MEFQGKGPYVIGVAHLDMGDLRQIFLLVGLSFHLKEWDKVV